MQKNFLVEIIDCLLDLAFVIYHHNTLVNDYRL